LRVNYLEMKSLISPYFHQPCLLSVWITRKAMERQRFVISRIHSTQRYTTVVRCHVSLFALRASFWIQNGRHVKVEYNQVQFINNDSVLCANDIALQLYVCVILMFCLLLHRKNKILKIPLKSLFKELLFFNVHMLFSSYLSPCNCITSSSQTYECNIVT